MTLKDLEARVGNLDAKLRADDPRFGNSVDVLHREGTHVHFEHAFAVKIGEWYVVFTEHHGTHTYCADDVCAVRMHGPRLPLEKFGEDFTVTDLISYA